MNNDWEEDEDITDVYMPPLNKKLQKMKDYRAYQLEQELYGKRKKFWKKTSSFDKKTGTYDNA